MPSGMIGGTIQSAGVETGGAYTAVGEKFILWYSVKNTGQLPMLIRGIYLYNGTQRAEDMSAYQIFAPDGINAYVSTGDTRTHQITCTVPALNFGDSTRLPTLSAYLLHRRDGQYIAQYGRMAGASAAWDKHTGYALPPGGDGVERSTHAERGQHGC